MLTSIIVTGRNSDRANWGDFHFTLGRLLVMAEGYAPNASKQELALSKSLMQQYINAGIGAPLLKKYFGRNRYGLAEMMQSEGFWSIGLLTCLWLNAFRLDTMQHVANENSIKSVIEFMLKTCSMFVQQRNNAGSVDDMVKVITSQFQFTKPDGSPAIAPEKLAYMVAKYHRNRAFWETLYFIISAISVFDEAEIKALYPPEPPKVEQPVADTQAEQPQLETKPAEAIPTTATE